MPSSLTTYFSEEMTEDDKQRYKNELIIMTLWTKQPLLWLIGGICHTKALLFMNNLYFYFLAI